MRYSSNGGTAAVEGACTGEPSPESGGTKWQRSRVVCESHGGWECFGVQAWSEDLGLEGECRSGSWMDSTAAWVGIVEGPGNDEQLPRCDLRQLPDSLLGVRSNSRCGRTVSSSTIFRGLKRHLRLSVDAGRTEEMEFMLKLESVATIVAARKWQITGRPRTIGWARRHAPRHLQTSAAILLSVRHGGERPHVSGRQNNSSCCGCSVRCQIGQTVVQ